MALISPLPSIRLDSMLIGTFIEEVCHEGLATTIIACCSRSYFLRQLIEYTRADPTVPEDDPKPALPNTSANLDEQGDEMLLSPLPRQNPLLLPTLKLIAASSQVKLVFCPTIPIFRAYLSTLPTRAVNTDASKIIVLNVLALHRDTLEYTVQGLSRSFAMIASVNHKFHGKVELLECAEDDDASNTGANSSPWNVEVPLLSGSIKIGDAGQGWARRTVSISKFAERWFNFE